MSCENVVNSGKVNRFDTVHIRSVVSLALFGFVFLGVEFFFDSYASKVVDAKGVLLYQSVILLASVAGLFIYALLERTLSKRIIHIVLIALNIVGLVTLAGIILASGRWLLGSGIIFFVICGITGGFVYFEVANDYTDRKHLTVTVGISYALGLLLQYINYNLVDSAAIRFTMFALAVAALTAILLLRVDIDAANDRHRTEGKRNHDCQGKSDNNNSVFIAVVLVTVILLMTFIFSALDNVVTLVHAEGGADIGQWPRLFLALSGIAAGVLFDIRDQRFMNQIMYCVTVLSVIAMLVIEFGGAFIIGLIVFYLAAGFFVVYFTTSFINISYNMSWPSMWTGAGRAVNNIGAGIVGIMTYVIPKTPGIMVMSILVIVLLVLISIAVFVLDSIQKRQYRHYDEENVTKDEGVEVRKEKDIGAFADKHKLTAREREVLQKLLVSDGSVQDIADELYISRASLYRHISSMNEKTGTRSRVGLIQYYYGWSEDADDIHSPAEFH